MSALESSIIGVEVEEAAVGAKALGSEVVVVEDDDEEEFKAKDDSFSTI